MRVEAGQMLLHYRMVAPLGRGGMGEVWRARDTTLDRDVAIKFLPADLAADATRLSRLEREAKLLATLNHPEIASVYALHEAEGMRFLAMECIEGDTLRSRLPPDGLAWSDLLAIARPLTAAVAQAHRRGITHRDLKPDNVMVTTEGRIKVLDFGLAKVAGTPASGDDTALATATAVTGEGRILGSVPYMSPEQAEGKPVGPTSDVFALGILLFEMATGQRPFSGESALATLSAILKEAPPRVGSIRPDLPRDLEAIVARCLQKDPARRYRDAGELREALAALPDRAPGGRGRSRLWLGLAAAVVLAAGAAFSLWPRDGGPANGSAAAVPAEAGRHLSIAVLPFTNAGGDPEHEYFSDGLTNEVINELSRFQELFVISGTSTFQYKGRSVDVRTIGQELGVRYVLEGAVQRAGDSVRVSARLSDAESDRQLWGERFDRSLTARDLFSLQDELTLQVANAIAGSYGALFRAELAQARTRPPASLDAYDCVLRTYEYLHVHTAEIHAAARDCLERTLPQDPGYAEGQAWLAYLYAEEFHHRRNERPGLDDPLERAFAMAREAVRLNTASQNSHGVLALTHFFRGEYPEARLAARRTVDLNPNSVLWLALMGTYFGQLGDFEQGVPMIRKAVELTPHPPPWITFALFLNEYMRGRYEEALVMAGEVDMGDDDFRTPLAVAAAYGQLGRPDRAAPALEKMLALWGRPAGQIRDELVQRHAFAEEVADRLLDGLRKAGLPADP